MSGTKLINHAETDRSEERQRDMTFTTFVILDIGFFYPQCSQIDMDMFTTK